MDFVNAAKAAMNAASDAASQRYETAAAGKRLLDEGGPAVGEKIAAKAHCRRTVNADALAAATLNDTVAQYEEAIGELTRALGQGACTPEERYDFQQLLGQYEARANEFREAAKVLRGMPPPAPFISEAEDDAIKILWARGKARTAKERAAEVSASAVSAAEAARARA